MLSLILTTPAAAAEGSSGSAWKYQIGAAPLVAPNYEGSKHYEVRPLPLLELSWRDTVSLGADGLKVTFHPLADRGFFVSGGIGYWAGRKEGVDKDHGDSLRGLGNLSSGAVDKFETGYRYGRLLAGIDVARDIGGDRDGTTVTPKLAYTLIGDGNFSLTGKVFATWADDDYMQSMFGITPLQSLRSLKHYTVYTPGAGMKDAGFGLAADYRLTGSISLIAFIDASRLLGDAADSPIVTTAGSKNQLRGAVGAVYRF